MGHPLKYVFESLSNYIEDDQLSERIYRKLEQNTYESEEEFIEDLQENEAAYLDALLEREISYARSVDDTVRVRELSGVYELLP